MSTTSYDTQHEPHYARSASTSYTGHSRLNRCTWSRRMSSLDRENLERRLSLLLHGSVSRASTSLVIRQSSWGTAVPGCKCRSCLSQRGALHSTLFPSAMLQYKASSVEDKGWQCSCWRWNHRSQCPQDSLPARTSLRQDQYSYRVNRCSYVSSLRSCLRDQNPEQSPQALHQGLRPYDDERIVSELRQLHRRHSPLARTRNTQPPSSFLSQPRTA